MVNLIIETKDQLAHRPPSTRLRTEKKASGGINLITYKGLKKSFLIFCRGKYNYRVYHPFLLFKQLFILMFSSPPVTETPLFYIFNISFYQLVLRSFGRSEMSTSNVWNYSLNERHMLEENLTHTLAYTL